MTVLVYRQDGDRTVIDEDDGCLPGRHRRDELCARTPLKKLLTDGAKILSYHYGPTADDPDPGAMWCYSCGGRVMTFDGHAVCGCGAQLCESPVDCGDDNCEYRERGGAT